MTATTSHNTVINQTNTNIHDDTDEIQHDIRSISRGLNTNHIKLNTTDDHLLIMQWNCNGYSKYKDKLIDFLIIKHAPHVIILQEAHIQYQPNHEDYEIKKEGYKHYVMDSGYGKVVTLVQNHIKHRQIKIDLDYNQHLTNKYNEYQTKNYLYAKNYFVCTEIANEYMIINGYRTQNKDGCTMNDFMKSAEQIESKYPNHKTIVGADFNAHSNRWSDIPSKNRKALRAGTILENWIDNHRYQSLNTGQYTWRRGDHESTPDVTIVNDRIDIDNTEWWTEDYGSKMSDHSIIFTSIKNDTNIKINSKPTWRLRTGDNRDWESLSTELSNEMKDWNNRYGDKLKPLQKWYRSTPWKEIAAQIENKLNEFHITREFILKATNALKKSIADTSKRVLGVRRTDQIQIKPWITQDLINLQYELKEYKDRFDTFSKRKKKRMKYELNDLKDRVQHETDDNERKWYDNMLANNDLNGAMSWRTINSILNHGTKTKETPNWIDKDGNQIENPSEAYNDYKHRYETKPNPTRKTNRKYDEAIEKLHKDRYSCKPWKKCQAMMYLMEASTTNRMRRLINTFNPNATTTKDFISWKVMQRNVDIFVNEYTLVCNCMYVANVRPSEANESDISAIYKGNKKIISNMENWRPISCNENFFKAYDKDKGQKLHTVIIYLEFIQPTNYGFVKGVSTIDACAKLVNGLKQMKKAHVCWCDIYAAYDGVIHKQMIIIMTSIGFESLILQWITSSLMNRRSRVIINGIASDWQSDSIGLPQGWCPSQTLFLIYGNDTDAIIFIVVGIKLIKFADDFVLYAKALNGIKEQLNIALDFIDYALKRLGLGLAPGKSDYKYIDTINDVSTDEYRNGIIHIELLGVHISNSIKAVRWLGFKIDANLNWAAHISELNGRVNHCFYNIRNKYNKSQVCKQEWIESICKAILIQKMTYGIEIWGESKDIKKLKITYNNIARFTATSGPQSTPLDLILEYLEWPSFEQLIDIKESQYFTRMLSLPTQISFSTDIANAYKHWNEIRCNDPDADKQIAANVADIRTAHLTTPNSAPQHIIDDNQFHIYDDTDNEESYERDQRTDTQWIDKFFKAAIKTRNDDYLFMKNINYENIPKSELSNLMSMHKPPSNIKYHKEQCTADTIKKILANEGIGHEDATIICTDGSLIEGIGGAGGIHVPSAVYIDGKPLPKIQTKPNQDIWFKSKAMGARNSIEYAELEGIKILIDEHSKRIEDKMDYGLNIAHHLILTLDNLPVVQWITNYNEIKEITVELHVINIWNTLKRFECYGITTHVIWIKGHSKDPINDAADDLAKHGAIRTINNLKRSNKQKLVMYQPSLSDWIHVSRKARIKSAKRRVMQKNKRTKSRDPRMIALQKNKQIIRQERKQMTMQNWRYITSLRTGHSKLKGQTKWTKGSKLCDSCEVIETTKHHLLYCTNSSSGLHRLHAVCMSFNAKFESLNDDKKIEYMLYPDVRKQMEPQRTGTYNEKDIENRICILRTIAEYGK
eukprot:173637_1